MGNIHALIIDDNPINLKVLSQLLSLAGATYTAVQDPRKVMDVLQNLENVSVIFLDLEMPQINGYEMLTLLKEQVGIAIPIVACTVHTSEMTTAHELGFHSLSRRPSGLRKTIADGNSLAHRTTWLRSDFPRSTVMKC